MFHIPDTYKQLNPAQRAVTDVVISKEHDYRVNGVRQKSVIFLTGLAGTNSMQLLIVLL